MFASFAYSIGQAYFALWEIMMNVSWKLIVVVVLETVVTAATLTAAPAPLDPEELLTQSDLVVEVHVLSVTKLKTSEAAFYRAELHVLRLIKGQHLGGGMFYDFNPPAENVAGEKNFSVFAGERLRMHLVLEQGKYVGWAQNSFVPLVNFPAVKRVLPNRIGQTIRESSLEIVRQK